MFATAIRLAKRTYEANLATYGTEAELRKRLVAKPTRTGNDVEVAYGRKDPVLGSASDWDDAAIFDQSGTLVRIWVKGKTREASLYDALQNLTGRSEATASLTSDIAEGDVLVINAHVFEVVSVNRPSVAVCLELDLLKRS